MSGKPWSELFPICFFYDIAFNPPKNNTEAYQFWINSTIGFGNYYGLNSTIKKFGRLRDVDPEL